MRCSYAIAEPDELVFAPRRAEEGETDGYTRCRVYGVRACTSDGDVFGIEAERNCQVARSGYEGKQGT